MFGSPPVQLHPGPDLKWDPFSALLKKLPSDVDGFTCVYFFLMFLTCVIEGQSVCFGFCTAWKHMFPMVKHFKGCVIPKTSGEITFWKHLVPSAHQLCVSPHSTEGKFSRFIRYLQLLTMQGKEKNGFRNGISSPNFFNVKNYMQKL